MEENIPDKVSVIHPLNKSKNDYKPNKRKWAYCYEYEGFSHTKTECPTYLKRQKMDFQSFGLNLMIEWRRNNTKVMTFIGKYDSFSESSDENVSTEKLVETYRHFLTEWKKSFLKEEKQKKTISVILMKNEKHRSTFACLKEEVTLLKSKLDNMTKSLRMLNNGSNMLDEVLEIGEKKAIVLDYISMNKKVKITTKKIEVLMKDHMSQHPVQHV